MKLNVLKLATILTAMLSLSVMAEAVTGVTCSQRWPWNGKVDISYNLSAYTEKTTPVFSIKFYGKIGDGETFPLTTLEGDGSTGITLGEGQKRTTWDAETDLGTNIDTDAIKVAVVALDVTDQATYLKLDLTTGEMTYSPDITINDAAKTTELWLRRVENGTFTIGSPTDELGRRTNETQHQVTLTKAYYVGVFETTQKQYETVTGSNPSQYKGDARPVEKASYNMLRGTNYGKTWPTKDDHRVDGASFFGQLRAMSGNGLKFDLPTEAQWEYACRAETTTALNSGKNLSNKIQCNEMAEVGRYYYNGGSSSYHTTVGSYLPNAWGLYDMHGNVWEWCLDWYQDDLGTDSVIDPEGAGSGTYRVLRGGSWKSIRADDCRSAYRNPSSPLSAFEHFGFRVVLVQ